LPARSAAHTSRYLGQNQSFSGFCEFFVYSERPPWLVESYLHRSSAHCSTFFLTGLL
jgi:hypothetical protein